MTHNTEKPGPGPGFFVGEGKKQRAEREEAERSEARGRAGEKRVSRPVGDSLEHAEHAEGRGRGGGMVVIKHPEPGF